MIEKIDRRAWFPVALAAAVWFVSGDQALASIRVYAKHPMSFYGQGQVSADFVAGCTAWLADMTQGPLMLLP